MIGGVHQEPLAQVGVALVGDGLEVSVLVEQDLHGPRVGHEEAAPGVELVGRGQGVGVEVVVLEAVSVAVHVHEHERVVGLDELRARGGVHG